MNGTMFFDSGCNGCAFHRKGCVLGRQRVWNAARCEEFQPFCLICDYPEYFCYTCQNLRLKRYKPGHMTLMNDPEQMDLSSYSCVWQPAAY